MRAALAAVCTISALVLGWAELRLPPRWNTLLGLTCAGLALLHVIALYALIFAPRLAAWALSVLGAASLLGALLFTGALAGTSLVLVQTHGPLGWGLAALLGAILVLLWAFTLPIGLLSLWLTRSFLRSRLA